MLVEDWHGSKAVPDAHMIVVAAVGDTAEGSMLVTVAQAV